jgi:hypothetical protein
MEAGNGVDLNTKLQYKRRRARPTFFKKYLALGRCGRRPLDRTSACNFSCRSDNLLNLQGLRRAVRHTGQVHRWGKGQLDLVQYAGLWVSSLKRMAPRVDRASPSLPLSVTAGFLRAGSDAVHLTAVTSPTNKNLTLTARAETSCKKISPRIPEDSFDV